MPATRSPGHWTRRLALVAAFVLAFWIVLAFPDLVGIPVAIVVTILIGLVLYVQADRDRLARSNAVLAKQFDRADAEATRWAGRHTNVLLLADQRLEEIEKLTAERTELTADVVFLSEQLKSAQAKQFAAEARVHDLEQAAITVDVTAAEEKAVAQVVRDLGSSPWPLTGNQA
jgi:hypothetical protein